MPIKKILVTGRNGQLGWSFLQSAKNNTQFEFVFTDRASLDLSKPESFEKIIRTIAPDCIINTAAYTAVDKAETEKELAYTINATAVGTLASIANALAIPFITYSTDYVFSGKASRPYLTDTLIDPINYYGSTKAVGEKLALAANKKTIIIRTSWVFSSHGNNFVKTMIRLMKEKDTLKIVDDQHGRPTSAIDLAEATLKMIAQMNEGIPIQGIYHFANKGETTWYQFAVTIKELANLSCTLEPVTSDAFPTPAKRPGYSVLDTLKIEQLLNSPIQSWEAALSKCIVQLV